MLVSAVKIKSSDVGIWCRTAWGRCQKQQLVALQVAGWGGGRCWVSSL